MRNIYSVVIVLALMVAFSACSNGAKKMLVGTEKITEPEQIGQQLFDILRKIDFKSDDGEKIFAENFLSYQEVLDLAEDDSVTKDLDVKNSLTSITEDDWTWNIRYVYIDMLSKTLTDDFYLENIEFKYFTYHLGNDNGGGKFVEGLLGISHKDDVYEFETYSIWNGEEYVLVGFEKKVSEVAKSSASKVTDPKKAAMLEQMGHDLFKIIKGLDDMDEKTFMENILSLEELHKLGKGDKITSDPAMRKLFLISEEEYSDYFLSMYENEKEDAEKLGVVLKHIKYSEFDYGVTYDEGGGEFVKGYINFKHKDEEFSTIAYLFWDGEKYVLYSIE